jgi:S-formylglutathione hydrolase FrmB
VPTRRTFLTAAGGLALSGAAATVAVGPTRVGRRLGLIHSHDLTLPRSGWPVEEHTLASAAMKRDVRWAISRHPKQPSMGVIIALHGRNNNRRAAFDTVHLHDAVAAAGHSFAVVGVDGGASSYWHARRDGTDALALVLDELIPAVDSLVGGALPRAIIGWSMGGYGALLAAETAPAKFRAVIAASPALWEQAGESASGAFDDADDFNTHNVFNGIGALRDLTVRIDCGTNDGFIHRARLFAEQLPTPNQGTFTTGYHDGAYWRSIAPAQVETIASALASAQRSASYPPATLSPSPTPTTVPSPDGSVREPVAISNGRVRVISGSRVGWIAASPANGLDDVAGPDKGRLVRLDNSDLAISLGTEAHSAYALPGGPPLAVPVPGNDQAVFYLGRKVGTEAWPDLRLASSNRDDVVVAGATTFAVSPKGSIATAIARNGGEKEGPSAQMDVFVRTAADRPDVLWSPIQDQYRIEAWVGDSLIVTRSRGEAAPPDLLRFDGPNAVEIIAERAALVAISPDGSTAVINRSDLSRPAGSFDELIDVRTGKTTGSLNFAAAKADVALGSGHWDQDGLVTWGFADGKPTLFKLDGDSHQLTLVSFRSFDAVNLPTFFSPTRAADGSIVALAFDGPIPRPGPKQVVPENPIAMVLCSPDLSACEKVLLPGNQRFDIVRNPSK